MSSSLSRALADAPNLRLHRVFKSLGWAESMLWCSTGHPDAFAKLLASCSSISYDRSSAPEHQSVALHLLSDAESASRKTRAPGSSSRQTLEKAVLLASSNEAYAGGLASLCGIYYFLRRLDVFELDDTSLGGLTDALRLDQSGEQVEQASATHKDALDSLNACLGRLETKYPGIKLYTNCAMLETNIGQEFGVGLEPFAVLRNALPGDGELYLATLRCIVDCLQRNLGTTQTLHEARRLYTGSLDQYWVMASNFIWELQDGMSFGHELDDDEYLWEDEEFARFEDAGGYEGIDEGKPAVKELRAADIPVGVAL
ncbi:hypothetical protein GQ54DRAFT_294745 [Martensiomyces pterosporus]|nr:hypothetical protein GQ54DRAFT_294745 [Martensiomyces pterosporus]